MHLHAPESVSRNIKLQRLVVGRLLATVAEWMWYTVTMVYAFTLAGVGAVGAISVAAVLPAALLSPALGYIIDRYARERILTAVFAIRFVAIVVTAVSAVFIPTVSILVAVIAVEGISAMFVRPTTAALLPSITQRPQDLVRGHAALGTADKVGILIGPVAGGLMLACTTPAIAVTVAAVLALGSIGAVMTVRVDVADRLDGATGDRPRHALGEAARGVRTVAGPHLRSIVVVTALAFLMLAASEVFVVPLAIDLLHWGQAGPGVLTALIAGGGLLGGLALGAIGNRRLGPWFVVAGGVMAIALTLMAAAPHYVVVLAATVAFGAGSALVMMAGQVQIQSLIPLSAGGRVLGAVEGLSQFAMAAGAWATTRVTQGWSLRTSLLALAVLTVLATLGVARSLLRTDARVAATRQRVGALDDIALFAPLTNVLRERIATQIYSQDVGAGEVVTYQGEYGDSFYIVESGKLDVCVDGRHVRSLGAGDFFGELALLRDTPRTATVRATADCRLWVLPRRAFLTVLTGFDPTGQTINTATTEREANMPATADDRDAALAGAPLLAALPADTIRDLAAAATTEGYDAPTVVFGENDPAHDAYFIVDGRVDFDRAGERIRALGPGRIFGEVAVLRPGATRAATATATAGTVLWRLPGERLRAAVAQT
ncbi:MFS transporter [Mycobacterium sp. Aquia_213]|uniref:MFS transporter n=1 Tax=Mycobacterium sp. Aquia_213 TaxID=2991728 RepID=UPI002270204F|nr:MFS transporter [Mycobacterium sp. Aquia_213]WAC89332.1 MFS transporter [Mycobacterium sp. Aquia_213]